MAGPNSEQLKAIEHQGGVLLSAGAGSGKTFVLTEHLIYLANKWIESWSVEKDGAFDVFIKGKFSKVVLMTFTNKAAGEISVRINEKFQKALAEAQDKKRLWEKAMDCLDTLTVSTIHGYCYKLIKQGFFNDINPSDEIIGEAQFAKQIEDIFNAWLEKNLSREDQFLKVILKEKRAALSALKTIISDPTLRLMWREMEPESFSLQEVDQIIKELLFHQNFSGLFDWNGELSQWAEFEEKDWFKFLQEFQTFFKNFDCSLRALNKWILKLAQDSFKIPVAPRAKAVPEQAKVFYKQVRDFKDFLKKNQEDFLDFEEKGPSLVSEWYGAFRSLLLEVDKAYSSANGFTFGDLEFVVNEKLEDPAVREMVKKEYQYLIIDEFQDTSHIQFAILGKIIDFDYHKVFCVGDIKQAIYGFRGGELGVFLKMQEKAPLNLNLLNNYRSDKNVIEFNNKLFSHLFKLGLNFEGTDHYAVEVARQTIPLSGRPEGKVFEIDADLSFLEGETARLSVSDVEYLEALVLAKHIETALKTPGQNVAVLYRKLKPSKTLMQLLLNSKIGFTSQVKVPMLEDPILGIFHLLIKSEFDQGKLKESYLEFALTSYFMLLGKERADCALIEAKKFLSNQSYFGAYQAFLLFLSSSGLVVSNYKNNLQNIKLLIDMNHGDLEKVAHKMDDWSGLNYSMEFQYGKDPQRVSIMSAHASKGLEFSQVLLGGIYTNDNPAGMKDMFGKTPFSFKWTKNLEGKKKYKTPHYMLEQAVQKHKEFSESKRLFYVACTRAENALGWARLRFGSLKSTVVKGSWIYGIDSFFEDSQEGEKESEIVRANSSQVDLKKVFDPDFLKRISNQPPMFHFDNLGVEERMELTTPILLPELSVTRLSQVSQCPRKFYLENVLKLEGAAGGRQTRFEGEDVEELSSKSFSTAQRGIEVHDIISQVIQKDFQAEIPDNYARPVNWVVDNLKLLGDNTRLISEKPVKFEVFHYMISGIPDLLVLNESGSCREIWDFKTGAVRGKTPENYWFQLYAYAYSQLHGNPHQGETNHIKLVLCYVDERAMVEKIVSKAEVDKYLWNQCQKLATPDEVNPEHCESCDFNKICKKKSVSSCATSFSC